MSEENHNVQAAVLTMDTALYCALKVLIHCWITG